MVGQRNRLFCFTCENNQPDPIARHLAHHVVDLLPGPSKPVGAYVLGQHAARNIQSENDFQALLRNITSRFAPANIHARQSQKHDSNNQ